MEYLEGCGCRRCCERRAEAEATVEVEVEQARRVSAFDVVGGIEISPAGVTFKVNDRSVIMVQPWVGESALDFMRRLDAIAGTITETLDAAFLVEDE